LRDAATTRRSALLIK